MGVLLKTLGRVGSPVEAPRAKACMPLPWVGAGAGQHVAAWLQDRAPLPEGMCVRGGGVRSLTVSVSCRIAGSPTDMSLKGGSAPLDLPLPHSRGWLPDP